MKTITTKLPAGEIIKINKLPDGTFEVVQEETKPVISCDDFVLIEAESLAKNDAFLQYEPKTEREKKTKQLILEAIRKKVKNFEHLRCDPSFTDDRKTDICFIPGKMPAVGKSYNWWEDIARKLKLNLGTRLQYAAFLGVLIKKLIEEGKTIEWAWNAVCNDSKELGHYWDSEDAKHAFEPTGSRSICGFCDLANTFKILAEDKNAGGFWIAGGYFNCSGDGYPLAYFCLDTNRRIDFYDVVGWLVH